MKKNIDAPIVAVTVYRDRALVTRENIISLTGEEKELIISQLPTTLETDSVRVTGRGTTSVKILGVRIESIFTPEASVERIAQLDRQIKTLQTQQESIENQLSSLQLQLNFVEHLSEKSKTPYSVSLAKQQTNLEQTQELLNFVGDKYLDYADRIAFVKQQQQSLKAQISALEKQKQNLQTPKDNKSLNLIVFIETDRSGEFELEVSYIVDRASWTPLYDLQVDTIDKHLNLSYLAEVEQNTGEDWSNVALTLSTAKPGVGSLPPKLEPWYIDIFRPLSSREGKLLTLRRSTVGDTFGVTGEDEYEDISATESQDEVESISAEVVAATVAKSGSVVTFEVRGGGNIPSDGTPHKVTIFNDRYPSQLEYIAVPRLVSFAYLQAKVTNPPTGVTLLPGKANIFRDLTFVGTTDLENIAPNQEFKLNLGIDEGWKIERDLVQRQVEKKLIGNRRRVVYAYRLVINNLLSIENSLKLIEQLPISRNEKLQVRLNEVNPKIKLGEMGILEWNMTVKASGKQEIYYQFVIEYPPESSIEGLNI